MRRVNQAHPDRQPLPPSNAALRRAVERDESEGTAVVVRDERSAALAFVMVPTEDPDVIVREVGALWGQAQRSFLAIGRYLLRGRAVIAERMNRENPEMGEADRRSAAYSDYKRLILAKLPFGSKVANQMECVARAVFETERLREDELPHNYSVAYQLTTLTDEEIEAARAQGLVGPKAKRDLIIEMKRRRKAEGEERQASLRARRARAVARIDALRKEVEDLDRELAAFAASARVPETEDA